MKINKHLFSVIAIIGFSIISNAQIPNYVPSNGLVGWWPFNGNANDESGNNNNGTVNGATLTNDRFGSVGQAYEFDGINDNIESMNPLSNLATDFTISCYVSINSWQGGEFVHVGIDQNSYPRDGFGYGYGASQAVFPGQNYLALVSDIDWYQSGYQFINLSTWYHAIVVRINNTLDYFVDGSFVGSDTISSIIPPSNSLFFGSGAPLTNNFNGKLDDIGIWSRALTQCEIQALYNSQFGSQAISAGLDQSICAGDNVALNASGGNSYQWNNNIVNGAPFAPTQTATYAVNGIDSLGCTGSDTVVISVLENASSTLIQTALDSYMLNGQTYTQSGTFTQVIPAANGCDSTITLNLTLNFTGIHELGNSTKTLVKIIDLNGKIIQRRKNTVMLFIYEDGTVERVVEME
jgi:hypothetical protein